MQETNIFDYRYFYRRYLLHIQPVDAVLFVTYSIKFEYPQSFYENLKRKKDDFLKSLKRIPEEDRKVKINNFNKTQFDITDNFIAKFTKSPKWLSNSQIANIIKRSLFYKHNKEYDLICYCLMPNHVHILIKPLFKTKDKPYSIAGIMKNHKSYTAVKSNKILKRNGQFWHRGYYDHYIRDENELYNVIRYILNNPVKAGLVKNYEDWEFSWVDERAIQL